ncbi:hypothetical protein MSAR_16610 [Mycolicibacterium sarraceniae]|uniref:Uncharacterized protein n=1 Tax=Mycolicibacterium sarraceniae TaxID=1534348 RepID=A0A7I7SR28_9MYCO|nr:hypothetical protein MSAR_16610 [Mycolicibacterium sarraceniae]
MKAIAPLDPASPPRPQTNIIKSSGSGPGSGGNGGMAIGDDQMSPAVALHGRADFQRCDGGGSQQVDGQAGGHEPTR